MSDISADLLIISQTINDSKQNPYLMHSWDANELSQKLANLSDSIASIWIQCITHLQAYAWRVHSKDCIKKDCFGGCGHDVARLFFHPKQAEFISWEGDEAWVITGNRWGKTDALVFRAVCQANGYNPLTNELYPVPQNIWIAGLDFPMVRDILVPKFKKQMPEIGLKWSEDIASWDFNKTDLIAKLFNGSEVGLKCIRYDQEVLMADGSYRQIQHIKIGDEIVVRHHFGKYGIQDKYGYVTKVFGGSKKELLKIQIKGGREIVCSPEHRIFNGREWKKAGQYRKGNRLPYRGVPEPIKTKSMDFNPWLLGFIIGDGCLRDKQIKVTNNDKDVLAKLFHEVNKIGAKIRNTNDDYTISLGRDICGFLPQRDRKGYAVSAKTSPLINKLKEYGLWGLGARDKFIPDAVFKTSNYEIIQFISGLYAADGTITNKPSISLSTSSRRLAYGLQKLLDRLSIKTGVYYIRLTDSWRIQTMCKYSTARFLDYIPWIKYSQKAKALRKKLPIQSKLKKFTIKHIEKLEPDIVYDLEIDGIRCYMTSGLTVHNSSDSGIEKFRGAGKDLICFDEETQKEVYSEATIRIEAGRPLKIRGAMTPDPFKGLTWTYKDILKNEERQVDPTNLRIWTGATTENPGLTERVIDRLIAKKEKWEIDVRIYGHYALGLGRCAFSEDGISYQRELIREPIEIRPITKDVSLLIFENPTPDFGYSIGVDTAEGLEHGDNSVAIVLKRDIKPSVAAILVGKIDPDTLGEHALSLADEYNEAYLTIETNNHGFAVISKVRDAGYGNMYSEKTFDKWGQKESRKWGWNTNSLTRPILVDAMVQAVRDKAIEIYDINTLDEMGTFIINEKGRAEAQAGCKDDRVMALGLSLQGHIRCPQYEKPVKISKELEPINEFAYMGA